MPCHRQQLPQWPAPSCSRCSASQLYRQSISIAEAILRENQLRVSQAYNPFIERTHNSKRHISPDSTNAPISVPCHCISSLDSRFDCIHWYPIFRPVSNTPQQCTPSRRTTPAPASLSRTYPSRRSSKSYKTWIFHQLHQFR